jgi:predicted AAA+ superfamily ATPase
MIKDSIPSDYEKHIIEMMTEDMSLSQAIELDLYYNEIDMDSVFDIVDYLEMKLNDLDKVQYYMSVYTGQQPDVVIKK